MATCIVPSSYGGGEAYNIQFSAGFGGAPGKSMVRFVNSEGSYTSPSFDLDSSLSVGTTGSTRPQTLVNYSMEQTPGGSTLVAEFEDKAIIDLQRTVIILKPVEATAPTSTACMKVLGTLYHKIPGSPEGLLNKTTLALGESPTIEEGGRTKKIAREYMRYNGSDLAFALGSYGNAYGGMLGPALYSQLSGINDLLDMAGDAMGIIQSLSKTYGFSLYANSYGALDAVDVTGGTTLSSALSSVKGNCNVVSYNAGSSIRETTAQGAVVYYDHDDEWLADMTQNFKALDLLGLALPACTVGDAQGGEKLSLYSEDMKEKELTHLKRLLKAAILDEKWQNWDGLNAFLHLKRLPLAGQLGAKKMNILNMKKKQQVDGKDKIVKLKIDCEELGNVPVVASKNIEENDSVNKLWDCMNPGILGQSVDVNGKQGVFDDMIEKGFNQLNVNAQNPALGPTEIIVLSDVTETNCDKLEAAANLAEGENVEDAGRKLGVPGGAWAQGGAADRGEMLSALAETIGRYWIMTGGGAGGGAGLITQRAHGDRDYNLSHGTLTWYDKRLAVTSTVFSNLYEKFFGEKTAEWEKAGGITNREAGIGLDENGDPILDENGDPVHDPDELNDFGELSVSQFLQLVSKSKALALDGKEDKINEEEAKAMIAADAKTTEDLAAEAKDNLENCAKNEPKGIVIWDAGTKEVELPLKGSALSMIAAGVEPYSDKAANDVMRWLSKQAKLGIVVNPMKGGGAAAGPPAVMMAGAGIGGAAGIGMVDGAGLPVMPIPPPGDAAPAGAAAGVAGDLLDKELDAIKINEDFDHIGEARVRAFPYKEKRGREYHYTHQNFPDCGTDAYKYSVVDSNISGQVLWRKIDCRGKVLPWTSDFNESGKVIAAASTKAADLAFTNDSPANFFTISTCGEAAANIPSVGEGMSSYSIQLNEDGSISSSFTVSSRERMEADSSVNKSSYASGDGAVSSGSTPDLTKGYW